MRGCESCTNLSHLSGRNRAAVVELVDAFPSLFPDVPSRTTVIEHDIDVSSAQAIKQHAYRLNPTKMGYIRTRGGVPVGV